MLAQHKVLFEQTSVRGMELKNRFAMAPMGPLGLGDSHGGFNQRGIDYYTERAKGGTGLIITGVTFADNQVEEHGMPNCPCATYDPIQFVRTAREMTERIHAYGSKVWLQMSGGFGRVTIPTNLGEYPPVAPSPIMHRWLDKVCRELTVDEIHHIVKQFGNGAFHAKRAGFDGVEIHAVHEGYLIDQFAISFFNHRTDEYGGSLENRLRFAKEIVEEIKARCGEDFVVALRYSPKSFIKDWRVGALPGEEFEEKGRDLPEGVEAAKLLVQYGYDCLDVDVGSYDAWWWSHPPMYQKKGLYIEYAKLVKDAVDVPVIAAGGVADGRQLAAAFALGACRVQIGTCLLVSEECPIHNNYKQALLKAKDSDTTVTGRSIGGPVRVLKNKMARQYLLLEKRGASLEELEKVTLGGLRRAVLEGDVEMGSVMSGQVAGMLHEIRPVAEIFRDLYESGIARAKATAAEWSDAE